MDTIIEYDEICDLVKGISDINLDKNRIIKKQKIEEEEEEQEEDIEKYKDKKILIEGKNKQLNFEDKYNNIDYLLSIDYIKVILPLSDYLTNLINQFLLEKMLNLININSKIRDLNISSLIDFYHFSLEFIKKFYSFQEQLNQFNIDLKDNILEKDKLKQYAVKYMNKLFNYKKLLKISEFLKHMNDGINFQKESNTYKDLNSFSKTFLIKIKQLLQELLIIIITPFEDNKYDFKNLRIYKKLDIVIPLLNIIQLIFYILVKN